MKELFEDYLKTKTLSLIDADEISYLLRDFGRVHLDIQKDADEQEYEVLYFVDESDQELKIKEMSDQEIDQVLLKISDTYDIHVEYNSETKLFYEIVPYDTSKLENLYVSKNDLGNVRQHLVVEYINKVLNPNHLYLIDVYTSEVFDMGPVNFQSQEILSFYDETYYYLTPFDKMRVQVINGFSMIYQTRVNRYSLDLGLEPLVLDQKYRYVSFDPIAIYADDNDNDFGTKLYAVLKEFLLTNLKDSSSRFTLNSDEKELIDKRLKDTFGDLVILSGDGLTGYELKIKAKEYYLMSLPKDIKKFEVYSRIIKGVTYKDCFIKLSKRDLSGVSSLDFYENNVIQKEFNKTPLSENDLIDGDLNTKDLTIIFEDVEELDVLLKYEEFLDLRRDLKKEEIKTILVYLDSQKRFTEINGEEESVDYEILEIAQKEITLKDILKVQQTNQSLKH